MPLETLNIDLTTTGHGRTQLFSLHGSLDVATSPSLRAALMEAADHPDHQFVVDLCSLEFLDSTGLGALIGAHRRACERGGSLRLVVDEGQILRLLRITGLLDVLFVYPSVDAALSGDGRLTGI